MDWPQNNKPPGLGQSLYSIAIPHQPAPGSEQTQPLRVSSTIQYSRPMPGANKMAETRSANATVGPQLGQKQYTPAMLSSPPIAPLPNTQYIPNTAHGSTAVGPSGPSVRPSPGQSTTYTPSAYTPVQFLEPKRATDTEQFYGTLIDAYGRPSEVMCRLADALFFYMDQMSDVHRNTGFIEPAKYGWFMKTIGLDAITASTCEQLLISLYIKASLPYGIQNVQGAEVPVLDRRGWLHYTVFEARACPDETHKHWSRMLDTLKLFDPSNNEPFPTPISRSAFPAMQDVALLQVYTNWHAQLMAVAAQEKTKAAATLQYTNMVQHTSVTGSIAIGTGGQAASLGLGNQVTGSQQTTVPGLQNTAGVAITGQQQQSEQGHVMQDLAVAVAQSLASTVAGQPQNAQAPMTQGTGTATAQPQNPLIAGMQTGTAMSQAVTSILAGPTPQNAQGLDVQGGQNAAVYPLLPDPMTGLAQDVQVQQYDQGQYIQVTVQDQYSYNY